jgi:hypothetical protein
MEQEAIVTPKGEVKVVFDIIATEVKIRCPYCGEILGWPSGMDQSPHRSWGFTGGLVELPSAAVVFRRRLGTPMTSLSCPFIATRTGSPAFKEADNAPFIPTM